MIRLTRLNHKPLIVNADLIEHVDATPDTVVSMTTGQKFVVLEPSEEIIRRVIEFRRAANGIDALPPLGISAIDLPDSPEDSTSPISGS